MTFPQWTGGCGGLAARGAAGINIGGGDRSREVSHRVCLSSSEAGTGRGGAGDHGRRVWSEPPLIPAWDQPEPLEDRRGAGLDVVGARALVVAWVAVLLQHRDSEALPREEDRCRAPAEPAASNDIVGCLCHGDLFLSGPLDRAR